MTPLWIAALWPAIAYGADVDRFEPSGSSAFSEGTLQGEAANLGRAGAALGLSAGYARDPVVHQYSDGRREPAVSSLTPMTLYGGYTFGDHGRLEAFLPFYAHVNAPYQGFSGPALGDVRLQANLPFYSSSAVQLSVLPRVGLPTGHADAMVRGDYSGGATLAASGSVASFGWLANAGIRGSKPVEVAGVTMGSSADLLAGAFYRPTEQLRVGAEIDLRMGLVRSDKARHDSSSAHLFAQSSWRNGLGLMVGGGGGLLGGIGAPRYRVFAALTWSLGVPDRDGDGIADRDDLCPDDPEDYDGFEDWDGCPDLDNDGDGIGDFMDQCPDEPEDLDGFQDSDGCPEYDNDGDGILDADDRCPDEPGPATTDGCPDVDGDGVADIDDTCPHEPGSPQAEGCPDADGDGVPDFRDACIDAPKPDSEEAARSDGCPKMVWLAGNRIGLGNPITFSGADRPGVDAASVPVLQAVAELLRSYPQLLQVEIQAHTDNTLPEDEALMLTARQAEAAVRWLVRRGISRDRLVAKGAGLSAPVDTNRTPSGRDANRRVELYILRQEAIERPDLPQPPKVARPATPPVQTAAKVAPQPSPPATQAAPAAIARPVSGSGLDPDGATGRLSVIVAGGDWANVYLNGERLTRGAPFHDLPVPAGVHTLWVANNRIELDHTRTITVGSGESVKVVISTGTDTVGDAPGASSPWDQPAEPDRPAPAPTQAPAPKPASQPEPAPGSEPAHKPEPQPTRPSRFDGSFPLFAEEREDAQDDDEDERPRRKRDRKKSR